MKKNFDIKELSQKMSSNYYGLPVSGEITGDQLGISITKSVFGWKYPASGQKAANGGDLGTNAAASNYIDQYGLPFYFAVGGQQILLPPVVQSGGTPVPYLPDNLTVVWASSFMGVPIPPDMIGPVSYQGKLRFYPGEMASAQHAYPTMSSRAAGSWSNAVMISNGDTSGPNMGETLIRLLMATMECLIYSYSSYPWGNGYNDLSDACMTKRTIDNMLVYPYQKTTVLGSVVKAVAPVFTNYIAPIINVATAGAASGLTSLASKGLTSAASSASANQAPQEVTTALTTTLAPPDTSVSDIASSLTTGSIGGIPIIFILAIAIIILIVWLS